MTSCTSPCFGIQATPKDTYRHVLDSLALITSSMGAGDFRWLPLSKKKRILAFNFAALLVQRMHGLISARLPRCVLIVGSVAFWAPGRCDAVSSVLSPGISHVSLLRGGRRGGLYWRFPILGNPGKEHQSEKHVYIYIYTSYIHIYIYIILYTHVYTCFGGSTPSF